MNDLFESFYIHHENMKDMDENIQLLQQLLQILEMKLDQTVTKQDLYNILLQLNRISKISNYLQVETIRLRMIDCFNHCLQLYKPFQREDRYCDREVYREFTVELFQNLILQRDDGKNIDYSKYPAIYDLINGRENDEQLDDTVRENKADRNDEDPNDDDTGSDINADYHGDGVVENNYL